MIFQLHVPGTGTQYISECAGHKFDLWRKNTS